MKDNAYRANPTRAVTGEDLGRQARDYGDDAEEGEGWEEAEAEGGYCLDSDNSGGGGG
ncbi:hypothetical protein Misp01_27550 [Microtetraspora sp. NBRC 13810]|nr:hypothetical protein Misp01_27550 [Microtetraspora sp. NBRC 13810]